MNKVFRLTSLWIGVAFFAVGALMSCDSVIYDEEGDCSRNYRVKLTYTQNMKDADAFSSEVTDVALYAIAPDGSIAWSTRKSADELRAADNCITVDVEPGHYDLVAWCGGRSREDNASLWILAGGDTPAVPEDLACTLVTDAGNVSDNDIHRLYHGILTNVELPDDYGTFDYTLDLTKDTNFVRVILQHADGEPVNKDWFTFTVTDRNSQLDHTNSPCSSDLVTYHPWFVTSAATEMPDPDNTSRTVTTVSSVIAEMTTSRLVTSNRPTLEINCTEPGNEHTVARLDLISYFLMIKGSANRHLSDQEFLDRQDDYTMMLILDDNNRWNINLGLYVNSWRIVQQEEIIH